MLAVVFYCLRTDPRCEETSHQEGCQQASSNHLVLPEPRTPQHTYTLSQSKKGTPSEPAVPMLKLATALPDEFRADLTNAWSTCTRNVTEVGAADVPGGVVKLRMVEDVEEFTSNLEMHCFIDRNNLRYAQIGIVDSWAMEKSPVRRSETSTVSAGQNPRRAQPIWVG